MLFYFRTEKERLERQRIADASKGMGRPKVGGQFELLNQAGQKFTSEDMKGRFSLVSGHTFTILRDGEILGILP